MNHDLNVLATDLGSSIKSWTLPSTYQQQNGIHEPRHGSITQWISSKIETVNWFINPSPTDQQRIWVNQPSYKSFNKWMKSNLEPANYIINPSSTDQQQIEVHQPSYEPFNRRIRSCWGSINRIMNFLINGLTADWNSSIKSWIFLSMD